MGKKSSEKMGLILAILGLPFMLTFWFHHSLRKYFGVYNTDRPFYKDANKKVICLIIAILPILTFFFTLSIYLRSYWQIVLLSFTLSSSGLSALYSSYIIKQKV